MFQILYFFYLFALSVSNGTDETEINYVINWLVLIITNVTFRINQKPLCCKHAILLTIARILALTKQPETLIISVSTCFSLIHFFKNNKVIHKILENDQCKQLMLWLVKRWVFRRMIIFFYILYNYFLIHFSQLKITLFIFLGAWRKGKWNNNSLSKLTVSYLNLSYHCIQILSCRVTQILCVYNQSGNIEVQDQIKKL